MTIVQGGRTNFGLPIGILMLDTVFPRIPGDVGNGFTFDFPVRYLKVEGANPKRVVREADPTLLEPFLKAARQLEAEGCQAITTSCGFLVMFQQELAAAVSVPVLSSSLLQVPFLQRLLGPQKKVGILTARACNLTDKHFAGAGIEKGSAPVVGLEDSPAFSHAFSENQPSLDVPAAEAEMVEAAEKLIRENPQVAAIVFECTNMPPYAAAVQAATGLPVYDITTLVRYTALALLRSPFSPKRL